MKRLTLFLVRRYLPNLVLIERGSEREYIQSLLNKHLPGHHIHRNPPEGKRPRREIIE